MRFGPNSARIKILRRAADADGNRTGDFAPAFETWAKWTQNPGVTAAVEGQREDKIELVVNVNDSRRNRTISNADRVQLRDQAYGIASVGLPERKSGSIQLALSREVNA